MGDDPDEPRGVMWGRRDGAWDVFADAICTASFLRLLPPETPVRPAMCDPEWGSEPSDVPEALEAVMRATTAATAAAALKEIAQYNFACDVEGLGRLRTHDDGEGSFTVAERADAERLLRRLCEGHGGDTLAETALANPGCYVMMIGDRPRAFETFEAYIAARRE